MRTSPLAAVALVFALSAKGTADTLHVPSDYTTIQAAIEAATEGDVVLVAPGTYEEAINILGKSIEVRSEDGAADTVIDGTFLGTSVITCVGGEGPESVVEGFTIRGGTGTYLEPPFSGRNGGGMLNIGSSPTVRSCVFRNNSGATRGGGVCNIASSPTIVSCLFDGNTTVGRGGAVYNSGAYGFESNPTFNMCTFLDNETAGPGGAMFNTRLEDDVANPILLDCNFVRNRAVNRGGAIYSNRGAAQYVNCVFDSNVTEIGGGGIYNISSSPSFAGCLFVSNRAVLHGGGIMNTNYSDPTIVDTTFRANTSGLDGGAMWNGALANPTLESCVLELNTAYGRAGGVYIDAGPGQTTIGDTVFCENMPDHIDGNWADNGGNSFSDVCCVGDIDRDDTVGLPDLLILLAQWGPCPQNCFADIDGDGIVGLADLLALLSNWGPCG